MSKFKTKEADVMNNVLQIVKAKLHDDIINQYRGDWIEGTLVVDRSPESKYPFIVQYNNYSEIPVNPTTICHATNVKNKATGKMLWEHDMLRIYKQNEQFQLNSMEGEVVMAQGIWYVTGNICMPLKEVVNQFDIELTGNLLESPSLQKSLHSLEIQTCLNQQKKQEQKREPKTPVNPLQEIYREMQQESQKQIETRILNKDTSFDYSYLLTQLDRKIKRCQVNEKRAAQALHFSQSARWKERQHAYEECANMIREAHMNLEKETEKDERE